MNKSLKIVSKSAQAPNCFLFPNICGSLSNTVKVPYGSKRRFPSNYVGGSIIGLDPMDSVKTIKKIEQQFS